MTNVSGETLSPLLDQFDAKTADDIFLRALAEEYLACVASDPENEIEIMKRYDKGMGIISSNNLHVWFNDRPIDPDNPSGTLNNINNPDYVGYPGVQGLLVLREQQPELFQEIGELSGEIDRLICKVVDNLRGKQPLSADEEKDLDTLGVVGSFKLSLAKTRAIELLQEMGVSEEALQFLYR